MLLPALAAALAGPATLLPPTRALAAETTLTKFSDSRYGVSFSVPSGWEAVPQELADGRKIVLASDPSDENANVFIAYTPIRPDYSSLGSFGTIDYVASTVIPKCGASGECRFANGDTIEGLMLSSDTVNGCYVYDYTIEQSRGPKRHLRSLFTIKADGGASVLIGLTAQCLEPRYAELASTYKQVLTSFKQ